MKSIYFTARYRDYWKIARTIRSVDDANKVIRDFRDKLRRLTPVPGDYITYKLNHEEYRRGIWNQKAIELAMLEAPLFLEVNMMLGLSPHTDCLSAVHEDVKLVECSTKIEPTLASSYPTMLRELADSLERIAA